MLCRLQSCRESVATFRPDAAPRMILASRCEAITPTDSSNQLPLREAGTVENLRAEADANDLGCFYT
jgi:hypothetical protein